MRRQFIGILALLFLMLGVVLTLWPPEQTGYQQFQAASWRVGALLAVLWLAYREVTRLPVWLLGTIPALVAVLAVRPKWFLIALPIVIVLVILSPRNPRRR
jgi:predicted ferric reductase